MKKFLKKSFGAAGAKRGSGETALTREIFS
jgi:hypothetical protein